MIKKTTKFSSVIAVLFAMIMTVTFSGCPSSPDDLDDPKDNPSTNIPVEEDKSITWDYTADTVYKQISTRIKEGPSIDEFLTAKYPDFGTVTENTEKLEKAKDMYVRFMDRYYKAETAYDNLIKEGKSESDPEVIKAKDSAYGYSYDYINIVEGNTVKPIYDNIVILDNEIQSGNLSESYMNSYRVSIEGSVTKDKYDVDNFYRVIEGVNDHVY